MMSSKKLFSLLVLLLLVVGLVPATVAAQPDPGNAENPPEPAADVVLSATGETAGVPSTPPQILADVDLILDDGTNDNNIGIGGGWEFIWVNRFTPDPGDYPFNLDEIWVYFESGTTNVSPGDEIILVVYENTSGNPDPAVGSNWLASFPDTVQAVDAWNVYDISATPVTLNGPGDVIIGVIGLEIAVAPYYPAAIDQTVSQQRSWAGWWLTSPPPSPPTLPPDDDWTLIDAYFPGNWMVRGYGSYLGAECTWVDLVVEDFETWPPADWTIVNNGGDCVWESTATTGRANYAGGDGEAADADSDWCGSGTTMDTELWSPPLNLANALSATVQYVASYYDITSPGDDYAAVDFSDDGGATWTNLLTWDESHDESGPGEVVTLNLDSYTGSPDSHISFHYYAGDWDWWYEVDEVVVSACVTEIEYELTLTPPIVAVEGCAGVSQTHTFELYNQTGVDDTFDLAYDVPTANGTLTGPPTLYVASGDTVAFDVELTPDACQFEGTEVVATIDASGTTTYTAQAVITKTLIAGMNEWLSAADTPQGTRYHAVAEHGGYIFQFGGETDWWTGTTAVNRYDMASDTWTAAASLPIATYAMDAVTIGDLIYIPGGSDDTTDIRLGGTFLNTLRIYDPVADSWSTGAAMPAPLAGASAVAYDGLLYVIGGLQNDGTAANTLYIYDPGTDSWTTGASMAEARSLSAAAAIDGKIYIAGGYLGGNGGDTTINSVEVYDIATDAWSSGSSLPGDWAPYGDGVFQDRYFVVFNGGDLSTAEGFYCSQDAIWYDTVDGVWDNLPSLNRCLYGSQGVGVGDRFYLVSGRTNEGGWHMAPEVEYLAQCPACTEIGVLEGYVLDAELGGMDAACTGGYVHVEPGNMFISAGPDGYYWAELFSGAYTVEASASGYSTDGPYDVDITTGMTSTQDFALWRPVGEVEPTEFVSVSVKVGEPLTLPLTIDNLGHMPLDFEILEVPPNIFFPESEGLAFLTTWLEGDVEVDPQVLAELEAGGTTDFFVKMRLQADLSPAYGIEDWSERGQYVYDSLQAAAEAQNPVIAYATSRGLAYETRLSNNSVFVKGGTLEDVNALAARADVAQIRANHIHELEDVEAGATPDAWGWNLDALDPDGDLYGLQAVQVWNDFGISGKGIVVANIDTGVTYEHEALVRQYRGNNGDGTFDHDYNWYAPTITASVQCGGDAAIAPCDEDDHGSGTAGIMVGETDDLVEQTGVAPGAQWIACMGCDGYGPGGPGGCSEAALTACADWMVAPCPIGADPGDPACDPAMRPHVVNNSWGDVGCDLWYQPYVQAWVAAGIFPAFSAGNTIACGAVGSPGDLPEAFGTAAHAADGENLYAGGPSCYFPNPSCDPDAHEVDPHLNAPSFGRAPGNTPGEYYNLSGTSGASPHTAGCVALMWAANPFLAGDIDTTFTILEQSADRTSTQPWAEGVCGKPACAGTDTYPNYEYGWGYLDCYAAVEWALSTRPDMDWVSVDPASGVVPPEDGAVVDVTFTCAETGDLTGTLLIQHNDPCADYVDIPLEIHCVECIEVEGVDLTLVTTGTIYTGDLVEFSAEVMPLNADIPFSYTIDYGDGTTAEGTSSDFVMSFDHTYTTSDTFTVEIGVWNCDITEPLTDMVDVTVMEPPAPPFYYYYLPMLYKNG
jgi:N-acetylneuraminic acid mutarotase